MFTIVTYLGFVQTEGGKDTHSSWNHSPQSEHSAILPPSWVRHLQKMSIVLRRLTFRPRFKVRLGKAVTTSSSRHFKMCRRRRLPMNWRFSGLCPAHKVLVKASANPPQSEELFCVCTLAYWTSLVACSVQTKAHICSFVCVGSSAYMLCCRTLWWKIRGILCSWPWSSGCHRSEAPVRTLPSPRRIPAFSPEWCPEGQKQLG